MRRIDIDSEEERIRIEFPYDESLVATVRSLPEREYDPESKNWFVPFTHVDRVLEVLLDRHFKISRALREFCRDRGRPVESILEEDEPASAAAAPVPPDTLSIAELNREAQEAIRSRFDEAVWVVGEIQSFDRNTDYRHAFFELVERPAEEADPVARIRAVMFEDEWADVEETLDEAAEEIRLRDGLTVRMGGEVELYPQKGSFQIVVREIDPTYTSGKIQRNRQRILAKLDDAGIRERNRRKEWPVAPLHVGLVTSHGSDAHHDFVDELRASGFGFDLTVVDARVQGDRTEASVLSALDWFERRSDEFDVVAIVRGGGARSDLAYFDTEAIGEAICRHPLKLICGVGHERDVCLLDHVCEPAKTPTAAGRELVERVEDFRERLERGIEGVLDGAREMIRSAQQRLERVSVEIGHRAEQKLGDEQRRLSVLRSRTSHAARDRLEESKRRVARAEDRLPQVARAEVERRRRDLAWAVRRMEADRFERRFDRERDRIDELAAKLARRTRRRVDREHERLDRLEERLGLLDPQNVLERGFAVVWRDGEQRRSVRSADDVDEGEPLEVEVADGEIRVRVDGD